MAHLIQQLVCTVANQTPVGSLRARAKLKNPLLSCGFQQVVLRSMTVSNHGGRPWIAAVNRPLLCEFVYCSTSLSSGRVKEKPYFTSLKTMTIKSFQLCLTLDLLWGCDVP